MNVVQVLTEAREIVRTRWCQGTHRRGELRCAAGAIGEVLGIDHDIQYLPEWVMEPFGFEEEEPLWGFNDNHTQEEVVALFDRAIERASV